MKTPFDEYKTMGAVVVGIGLLVMLYLRGDLAAADLIGYAMPLLVGGGIRHKLQRKLGKG